MSFNVKPSKAPSNNNRVEDGTYVSRIVQIIDLGEQPAQQWNGSEFVDAVDNDGNQLFNHELMMTFELPTEKIEIDGEFKPRWQSKRMKVSMHEKSNLSSVIQAADPNARIWNDKGFQEKPYDLENLIGKAVMVNIGSTKNGNAKVESIAGVPKGFPVDDLENEPKVFSIDAPDLEVWESMHDWQKEIIFNANNYKGSQLEKMLNTEGQGKAKQETNEDHDFDDDVPF